MTAEPALPELNDSTFYMLRCVVAVAAADKLIRSQELLFLNNLLIHYRKQATVTPAQVARLQDDLKHQQPVDKLLEHVTSRPDREQLVLFAGLMAQSDGEVHPAEEEVIRLIRAHCLKPPANDTAVSQDEPSPGPGPVIPGFDMGAFKKEIRSIVQQEFYKNTISHSGIAPKTGRVAVADAFVEPDPRQSRDSTYNRISNDAGRHRAVFYPDDETEPVVPKTAFGAKTLIKLLFVPALLWWAAEHANMVASSFTYHRLLNLEQHGFSKGMHDWLVGVLSSPLWGTLPGLFLRTWAGLLLLWRLWALWMSHRLSPLMRRSIVAGEKVLGKARFHFIYIAHPFFWAVLLWAASFKMNMFLAEKTYHAMEYLSNQNAISGATYDAAYQLFADPFWGTLPGDLLRGLAMLIIVARLLQAWTTEIVATDSRLLFRQGIFRVRTLKIDISNLRQVDVNQSWFGLLLDYGAIHIFTNSLSGKGNDIEASGIYIPPVADPHTFSTLVDRARRMWRAGLV
ncbi:MAG: PH domain-containing protein [Alphaproteobacteria bacterium]